MAAAAVEGVRHRTVEANGVRLHVKEAGPEGAAAPAMAALAARGYRAVAHDLRGYGDSGAPPDASAYTTFHAVGDLVALIADLGQPQVFVVGHDWGAIVAWQLCLLRPDLVRALVNLSVVYHPRRPERSPLQTIRAACGEDHYMCRFQTFGMRKPAALILPKDKSFFDSLDSDGTCPPWLSEEDISYYAEKFSKTGFTGGFNYYRCIDLNWELSAPWTGAPIKVPTKFIVGDLDITYNTPGVQDYIHKGGFKASVPNLEDLNQLRGEMCRGTYVLDAFRRRAALPGRRSHATARRSLGLPPDSDAADGLSLSIAGQEPLRGVVDTAQRSLIVIDFASGDTDEERWRGFRSSLRRHAQGESKIIVISRAETHSGLGTVPPLRLRAPRREELWYLFKALAFGGADPEERPELVRVATALFAGIPDLTPFTAVSKIAASLRADLSARSWRRMLKVFLGVTALQLGAAVPGGRGRPEEKAAYYHPGVPVKGGRSAPCLFYDRRKSTGMSQSELPKVTMLDVAGGAVPAGEKRFDVLVWQSRIPPYASYVATCDMERAAQVEIGKRRLVNKRRGQLVRGSGEDKV
ncbi:bifunctional epoxide hydrolase 2-like [Panicum miliaceum]|uniref:Bifunctional epoxide hydrolase 2-like n=1 Tax=Panicum miliaceum TaxID=4540 RepID=A0A3L6R2P5_PANMI|nr:bifunctional epoxide hydrolase 2-like [Panicum miliaceum]